jgi:hypothetical protein
MVGATVIVVLFHPGFMSPDSLNQLLQGRTGNYTNQHPPVMSWLLGRFDHLLAGHGPTGMLAFHALLLWSGLALLASQLFEGRNGLVWMAAVGFFPPVLALSAPIWKDVSMAAALTLAMGLLLAADRTGSRSYLWASLPPLFYAWAVRQNAMVAVVPLALLWSAALARGHQPPHRVLVASVAALSLLGGFALTAGAIQGSLTGHRDFHNGQTIPLFDLQAMSLLTHQNLMPPYELAENPNLNLETMQRLYLPYSCNPILYGPDAALSLTSDPAKLKELYRTWLRAILDHPMAYLRHRLGFAGQLLAVGREHVFYPFHEGVDANDLGVVWHPSRAVRWVITGLRAIQDTFVFRGWFYVLLLTLELAACFWLRAPLAPWCLAASGLFYALSLIPTAPGADFRYLLWPVVAALVQPAMLHFSVPRFDTRRSRVI